MCFHFFICSINPSRAPVTLWDPRHTKTNKHRTALSGAGTEHASWCSTLLPTGLSSPFPSTGYLALLGSLHWHDVPFSVEVLHMHRLSLNWDSALPHTLIHTHTSLPLSLAMAFSFFRFLLKCSIFRETFPDCLTPNPRLYTPKAP